MAALADLERLLERLFERTSARLFRSRVQAVHVERRLERAMESARTGRGASTAVPDRYRVRLHPADLDDLASRSGGPEALAGRLAERALAFARLHRYHLAGRPVVSVVADPAVERGAVEAESGGQPSEAGAGGERAAGPGAQPPAAALFAPPLAGSPATAGSRGPARAGGTAPGAPAPAGTGSFRQGEALRPAVRSGAPPPATALLRVTEPGGREREVRVEGRPLTVGRAADNDVVVASRQVSRHHGRFQNRHGALVYADLASTNGTRVNGVRVDEIVLGAGDRLQLGEVVVLVERLPH